MEDIKREILITARASGGQIFLTDADGVVVGVLHPGAEENYLGQSISSRVLASAAKRGTYTELGTLDGLFSTRHYVACKPIGENGASGYAFASSDARRLNEYIANLFSMFILSAGLMLLVSSVLSIVLTSHMTTPLRRISDAAQKFGDGDFAARVPVEGDDEVGAACRHV